jgi:hypothetical protein
MATGGEGAPPGLLEGLWALVATIIGGALAWIYRAVDSHGRQLADHDARLNSGGKRMEAIERKADKIDQIAVDVAFIRGRLSAEGRDDG